MAVTSMTCAIGLEVFAQSRVFWLSSAVLLIVGFAVTSQMTATNTLIQNRVPDELRSRVMAVYATMMMGMQPIGSLIAGGVAKHAGAPRTLAMFGMLVLVGSLVFLFRVVKRLRPAQAGRSLKKGLAVEPRRPSERVCGGRGWPALQEREQDSRLQELRRPSGAAALASRLDRCGGISREEQCLAAAAAEVLLAAVAGFARLLHPVFAAEFLKRGGLLPDFAQAAVFHVFKGEAGNDLRGMARKRIAAWRDQHQLAAPASMQGLGYFA